jgi:hypothetical protein
MNKWTDDEEQAKEIPRSIKKKQEEGFDESVFTACSLFKAVKDKKITILSPVYFTLKP